MPVLASPPRAPLAFRPSTAGFAGSVVTGLKLSATATVSSRPVAPGEALGYGELLVREAGRRRRG